MAEGDIDLSTLPPIPAELGGGGAGGGAPAAAAAPAFQRYKKGDKLPEGYTTNRPAGAATLPPAAAPAAPSGAAAPPAAAGSPAPAATPASDTEAPQQGDWISSVGDVASSVIPESWKQAYHSVQEKYGKPAERLYEKGIAYPTKGVAGTLDVLAQAPQDWITQAHKDIHTPYQQMPEYTRDIAEALVPQTIPDAAMTATAFAMPEIGAERIAGQEGGKAVQMARQLFGNRLARVGAGGLVGGATGGLTGTGMASGAAGGALGFAIPEVTGKAIESISRRTGEGALRADTAEKLGQKLTQMQPWLGSGPQEGKLSQALTAVGDRFPQTQKFLKAISDRLPWLEKNGVVLKTSQDFEDAFVHPGATNKAGDETRRVKGILNKFFGDRTFVVPEIGEDGEIATRHMTFAQADDLKTKYDRGGFALAGQRRSGITPRQYQDVGLAIRDHLASQMDYKHGSFAAGAGLLSPQDLATLKSMGLDVSGGVGKAYKTALNQYDAAKELSGVFRNKQGLFHPEYGFNQPELIDRLNKAAPGLDRAMGRGAAKEILDVIKRGFVGQGKDLEAKMAQHNWLKHAIGAVGGVGVGGTIAALTGHNVLAGGIPGAIGALYGWEGAKPIDPAGNVNWRFRPQMDAVESMLSNVLHNKINRWRADPANQTSDTTPAHDAASASRAENVAGPTATPDRVSLIQGHTEAIARGESPNVQDDLNRGNLSTGNVRKMLDNSKLSGNQMAFNNLSPQQAIDAFAQVGQGEKQALWPILVQHLQNSSGKMQPQERQQMLAQLQAVMTSGAA